MATIGYGDYYPRTIFGRIVMTICAFWGSFIVSMMVVVITNTLKMGANETRALIVLNRLEARKSLKEKAALLLSAVAKYALLEKLYRQSKTWN